MEGAVKKALGGNKQQEGEQKKEGGGGGGGGFGVGDVLKLAGGNKNEDQGGAGGGERCLTSFSFPPVTVKLTATAKQQLSHDVDVIRSQLCQDL